MSNVFSDSLEESANKSSPELTSLNNFELLDPLFIGFTYPSSIGLIYPSGTIFTVVEALVNFDPWLILVSIT